MTSIAVGSSNREIAIGTKSLHCVGIAISTAELELAKGKRFFSSRERNNSNQVICIGKEVPLIVMYGFGVSE
jgi:hypothetical protein